MADTEGTRRLAQGITPDVAMVLPQAAIPLLPEAEAGMTSEQLNNSGDVQLLKVVELLTSEFTVMPPGTSCQIAWPAQKELTRSGCAHTARPGWRPFGQKASHLKCENGWVRVTFHLPESIWAESIALVGEFNNWDPRSHLLSQTRGDLFVAHLRGARAGSLLSLSLPGERGGMDSDHADGYEPNTVAGFDCIVQA